LGQPTFTNAEGNAIDGGDDGPACCCVPLQPSVVHMNKPKALVTLAYNMVVCSSILVNRMTRQFEGDVETYTGGESMTAGEDCVCVCVEWNAFPLREYENREGSTVQVWTGSMRLRLPDFKTVGTRR